MPNLKTDRPVGLGGIGSALNVRRLMYQPLIWPELLRNQARRLRTPLDAEDVERAANALINRVR